MNHIDSKSTIEKLRENFARYGIPKVLFSDNGRQFVSNEFEMFCKINGILHKTSAPYHPATNGLAENSVGNFKRGISTALYNNPMTPTQLRTAVSRYLFYYRNAPHCSTGESPAKRFLGRELRNRLDLLRMKKTESTSEKQKQFFRGHRDIAFSEGEKVFIRNYKNPLKLSWSPATIEKVLGDRTYLCNPESSNPEYVIRRQTDQIIKTGHQNNESKLLKSKEFVQNKSLDFSTKMEFHQDLQTRENTTADERMSKDFSTGENENLELIPQYADDQSANQPLTTNSRRSQSSCYDDPKNDICETKKKNTIGLANRRSKRLIKPVNRLNL